MGEGFFDWIATSPGRIDPRSGEFVESTVIPEKERESFFDWVEVSPGRVNPKTGKLIIPTTISPEEREKLRRHGGSGRGEREEGSERSLSRFGGGGGSSQRPRLLKERPEKPRSSEPKELNMFDVFGAEPSLNGPGYRVGCDTCEGLGESRSEGPNVILWMVLGFGAVVALEALGITHWSMPKTS